MLALSVAFGSCSFFGFGTKKDNSELGANRKQTKQNLSSKFCLALPFKTLNSNVVNFGSDSSSDF